MKFGIGVSVFALALAAQSAADPSRVDIEGFIGVVTIEHGSTLAFDLDMRRNLLERPSIDRSGDDLIIDGHQTRGPRGCRSMMGQGVRLKWDGRFRPLDDFPHLTITVPEASILDADLKGGRLESDDLAAARLLVDGCGDIIVGNIAGHLEGHVDGSGDLIAKDAGSVELSVDGSGDIQLEEVTGPVRASVDGSGDIEIERVTGRLELSVDGSGDIHVDGGRAELATISLNGSGDITFDGIATDVSVLLNGSGDIYVAKSDGDTRVKRHGSGDVRIGKVSYASD